MTDTSTHQRLAQESEDMFERNLSLWAMKRQEVRIVTDGYAISGFLAGLDEYWVQVWGVGNGISADSFHLISKERISIISPTGKSTKDLNEEEAEEVENKVKNFANVSYAFNKSLREDKEGKNARTVGDTKR
jgi:hypothetical protein